MAQNDLPHDREPEPVAHAIGTALAEAVEYRLAERRRNARTLVTHGYQGLPATAQS